MEEKVKVDDEEKLKEKARGISIKEGSAYGLMDGFGLKYISPYALVLGATSSQIALLSSIPGLLGNISQLFSLRMLEKHSRKKIVIFGVALQAFMWLPLIMLGISFFLFNIKSGIIPILVIVFYTILTIFGAFTNPAWSSWMKDILPKNIGEYMGKRNKIAGIVGLVGLLIAGIILEFFDNKIYLGFLIIFSIAFIGRLLSAYLFTKKHEPKLKHDSGYYFSFIDFIKIMHKNNFGRFVIYVSAVNFATAIASPFVVVFMFKNLEFTYISFTFTVISSALASLLFMPLWGKFADKYGNVKTIKITGLAIPLIPLLWFSLIFFDYSYLTVVLMGIIFEFYAGAVWAGFNLAAANFIYEAVTRQRLALCTSYFNLLNSAGVFIATSLAAIFVTFDLGIDAILILFLISTIARFLAAIALGSFKEVKEVREFKVKDMITKINIFKSQSVSQYSSIKVLGSETPTSEGYP